LCATGLSLNLGLQAEYHLPQIFLPVLQPLGQCVQLFNFVLDKVYSFANLTKKGQIKKKKKSNVSAYICYRLVSILLDECGANQLVNIGVSFY